jgi:hypothetical protein
VVSAIVFDVVLVDRALVAVSGRGRRRSVPTFQFSCTTCRIDRPVRFEREQALSDRERHRAAMHPQPPTTPTITRR